MGASLAFGLVVKVGTAGFPVVALGVGTTAAFTLRCGIGAAAALGLSLAGAMGAITGVRVFFEFGMFTLAVTLFYG